MIRNASNRVLMTNRRPTLASIAFPLALTIGVAIIMPDEGRGARRGLTGEGGVRRADGCRWQEYLYSLMSSSIERRRDALVETRRVGAGVSTAAVDRLGPRSA